MDTPTLKELLSDGSFYASVALVAAAMAAVIGAVYVAVRRRRRNRRRRLLRYYGPHRRDGREPRDEHDGFAETAEPGQTPATHTDTLALRSE